MGQEPVDPTKGYKIIVGVLAAIVIVVSALFYTNINDLKEANLILNDEKISLTNELTTTVENLNGMTSENAEINESLNIQKVKADSLLTALTKEKSFSRSKIRRYEKELGTLRSTMKKYVMQIDSLDAANVVLTSKNAELNTNLKRTSLRADAAEEQTEELTAKLRKGAQISVRDISIVVSRKPDRREVKAKRAKSMRIDFGLSANAIAIPGERSVYCRVTSPEGYPLAESQTSLFDYEGEKLTYTATRTIDYQNADLKVSLYHDCKDLKAGKYTVEIFMDGDRIGSSEIVLR